MILLDSTILYVVNSYDCAALQESAEMILLKKLELIEAERKRRLGDSSIERNGSTSSGLDLPPVAAGPVPAPSRSSEVQINR